jgi:hypothetical protein
MRAPAADRPGAGRPTRLSTRPKQEVSTAADKAEDGWQRTRADAQAKVAELKAEAARRQNQIDADFAEVRRGHRRSRCIRGAGLRGLGRRERPARRSSTRSTPRIYADDRTAALV